MTKIYSMFELQDNRGHITYDFNPGKCELPVPEGTIVDVTWIGFYSDDEVACDVLQITLPDGSILKTQPNGTVLHNTWCCIEGVSPVQSGIRANTKASYFLKPARYGKATAKFYRA